MRPWLDTIVAVDEAERRGDAGEAMRLMRGRLVGPDGEEFWRPARINRLSQVVMLGPALPRWAVSRWIVAQAHDALGRPGDRLKRRCLELAIDVRGGTEGLSTWGEDDAQCTIIDHDWVYRQLYLYELGGLARFLRSRATPDLLAGADHIHDWVWAPMCAFRLVARAPDLVTWQRLDTGERLDLANIGSAAVVVPGEHAIGRLVPIESGWMLEGAPLVLPRAAAERVAAEPSSWIDAVRTSRSDIETGGFDDGLAHDVRDLIWQMVLRPPTDEMPTVDEIGACLARRTLALARWCLDEQFAAMPDDVDPWSCLRAALLSLSVVARLPAVAEPGDAARLDRLALLLAAPVDTVCRDLAREIRAAA
jgi:hypothetical protein